MAYESIEWFPNPRHQARGKQPGLRRFNEQEAKAVPAERSVIRRFGVVACSAALLLYVLSFALATAAEEARSPRALRVQRPPMKQKFRQCLRLFVVVTVLSLAPAVALAQRPPPPRDDAHDFDSEVGTWTIHTKRLMHPLAHANDWVTYDGTKTVIPARGGKANVAEVKEDGAAGRLHFIALRLYDPGAQQWSLNFMSAGSGTFGIPLHGGLRDGGIEFNGPDTFHGRSILVRFISREQDADHASSEQYFSDDGGRTWELNWVNHYTRTKGHAQ